MYDNAPPPPILTHYIPGVLLVANIRGYVDPPSSGRNYGELLIITQPVRPYHAPWTTIPISTFDSITVYFTTSYIRSGFFYWVSSFFLMSLFELKNHKFHRKKMRIWRAAVFLLCLRHVEKKIFCFSYRFSAFWLRSSLLGLLIILIMLPISLFTLASWI